MDGEVILMKRVVCWPSKAAPPVNDESQKVGAQRPHQVTRMGELPYCLARQLTLQL
jgi:hypothetical protein